MVTTNKNWVSDVIESLDRKRNIFWLASCFSNIKKPNKLWLLNCLFEGILRLFTNFYLYRKVSIFWRKDSDCKDVDLYNTRKRYTVIESLDLMRNISWLARSCFSKIKKPDKHCSGNQSVIAGVCIFDSISYLSLSNILIWTSTCGSAGYKRNIQNRKLQSKRVIGLMKYTHRVVDHNKVTQYNFFVDWCSHFENYFMPQPKNWHNRTTVLYTKYLRNTKKYFPSEPKKLDNTTLQLYCTLST